MFSIVVISICIPNNTHEFPLLPVLSMHVFAFCQQPFNNEEWYPTVGLICIFLIISDDEHWFMSLLAICMSSLEKRLFNSLFILNQVAYLLLSSMSSLYTLDINSLSDVCFANISHLIRYFFILMVSFAMLKLLVWCRAIYLFLLWFSLILESNPQRQLEPVSTCLPTMLSSVLFYGSRSWIIMVLYHSKFVSCVA